MRTRVSERMAALDGYGAVSMRPNAADRSVKPAILGQAPRVGLPAGRLGIGRRMGL